MVDWIGRRLVLLLTVVALAGLLLTACGGGDDDDDSGDDGGATATEADTGDASGDENGDGGGDDSGDDGGSDFDACSLLTQDEVERVIGEDADEGLNQNFDPIFSCIWSAQGGADYVTVGVYAGSDEELAVLFELTDDAEEVQGLGERAQFSETIGIGTLEVLTEGYDISVSVAMLERDADEARDITSGLAERALGRLP